MEDTSNKVSDHLEALDSTEKVREDLARGRAIAVALPMGTNR